MEPRIRSTREDQLGNRVLLGAIMMAAVFVAGCSSDGGATSGGTGQAHAVTAPDTPEGTLTELIHRIADGKAEKACDLFVPGGQAIFAQQFGARDCVTAMQIVIGKVTDPTKFAAARLKPSGKYPGVEVQGDSATFGGACTGWEYETMTGMDPGDLGGIKLKKTANGWFIYDVHLPDTTCGG
jgi:hypothetical protein